MAITSRDVVPQVGEEGSACAAPDRALFLFPDGSARSCCLNTVSLGNVSRDSLHDIWWGSTRRRLSRCISAGDFSMGCESCGNELSSEGRSGSYPSQFDAFEDGRSATWPATIGFYLSNRCNLQCVQCNGESSSTIRALRERRPPLAKVYSNEFFDELRSFIPHLRHASFVGGEPFLADETFRVIDLIGELAPGLPCTIVTNGTQFGPRVRKALDTTDCSIVVSLDASRPELFERIRVGASFEVVMRNLDRFAEYTTRRGTSLSINHCLMPQNHHDFLDLLLLAEARSIKVNVSVVRDPPEHSLTALPSHKLAAIHDRLLERAPVVLEQLRLNRDVLQNEINRIEAWRACDEADRWQVSGNSRYRIMMFRCAGEGPTDERESLASLREQASDGRVHRLVVVPGDTIQTVDPTLEQLLGRPRGSLDGRPILAFQGALVDAFGRMRHWDVLHQDDDRAHAVARFNNIDVLVDMVAMRNDDGLARTVIVLVACRAPSEN